MGKLSALKEGLEKAVKHLDDYSRFAADANKMDRALNQMGFTTIRDKSRVSGSEYILARTPDYAENEIGDVIAGREFKIRVSDHALPDKYAQADLDVVTNKDKFRGDAIGGWANAIKYISEQTGIQPRGQALRQVNEINRLYAEKVAREAAESEARQRILDATNAQGRDFYKWAQSLPEGSSIAVSNKGNVRAIAPDGSEIIYGKKPRGFSSTLNTREKILERSPSEWRSINAALDMSQAARMQRAAEQGFDTSKVWYHGTDADVPSFDLSKLGLTTGAPSAKQGVFFASTPDMAAAYPQYSKDLLLDYGGFTKRPGETVEQFRKRAETDNIYAKAEKAFSAMEMAKDELKDAADAAGLKSAYRDSIRNVYDFPDPSDPFVNLPPELGAIAKEDARKKLLESNISDKAKKFFDLEQSNKIAQQAADEYSYAMDWSKQAWAGGNEDGAWEATKQSLQPNIMPLVTNLKDEDLLIHDFGGSGYREISYNDLLRMAQEQGKKGALFKNTADPTPGDVLVVFDPSNIRSKFAAFDPAQKESSNLLAQFAPIATGTGLAALGLSPDETQAAINRYIQATQGSNPILDNLNRNLQQFGMNERGVPVTGTMQATPYPMLGKVADALRVVDTPIGPVFGGAADYLDKLAQGQKTTYFDRLGAALDVIP